MTPFIQSQGLIIVGGPGRTSTWSKVDADGLPKPTEKYSIGFREIFSFGKTVFTKTGRRP